MTFSSPSLVWFLSCFKSHHTKCLLKILNEWRKFNWPPGVPCKHSHQYLWIKYFTRLHVANPPAAAEVTSSASWSSNQPTFLPLLGTWSCKTVKFLKTDLFFPVYQSRCLCPPSTSPSGVHTYLSNPSSQQYLLCMRSCWCFTKKTRRKARPSVNSLFSFSSRFTNLNSNDNKKVNKSDLFLLIFWGCEKDGATQVV